MTFPFSNQQIFDFVVSQREDLTEAEYETLYVYYLDNALMPYGTAKARDGDPYHFIFHDIQDRFAKLRPTRADPIHYQGYEIVLGDGGLAPRFAFEHKDFGGEGDRRYGYGETMQAVADEIDEQVEDA